MSQHTSGPWTYDPNTETVDSGAVSVAGINVDEWEYEMAQANARLIAAAPEMYEALKAKAAAYEHHDECEDCMDGDLCEVGADLYQAAYKTGQAALAKAEGTTTP